MRRFQNRPCSQLESVSQSRINEVSWMTWRHQHHGLKQKQLLGFLYRTALLEKKKPPHSYDGDVCVGSAGVPTQRAPAEKTHRVIRQKKFNPSQLLLQCKLDYFATRLQYFYYLRTIFSESCKVLFHIIVQ